MSGRRLPLRVAGLLLLLLPLAGAGAPTVVHHYSLRADVCSVLPLEVLRAALGTPVSAPRPTGKDEAAEVSAGCELTFGAVPGGFDGPVVLTIGLFYLPDAVRASAFHRSWERVFRLQLGESVLPVPVPVPGLGTAAYLVPTNARDEMVMVLDGNAEILGRVEVKGKASDAPRSAVPDTLLVDFVRACLPGLRD
ncbi:hypothetical protein [Kitasatospora sp. NPDC050463]|uniref:hypothetical protein n=1 Tax=Kitasatospora sp. NPDC050463 TaxID=3155786 RepID=UPI0033C0A089